MLDLVDLGASLVPLEGMESLRHVRPKTTLNIVVDAKISLHHVIEIIDDLICVLVQQSLQLGHLLIVIEVLLILCIELDENCQIMPQCLYQLLSTTLLGQGGSLS